jgi:hypothetical protein
MIYEKMSVRHLGQIMGALGEAIGIVSWSATHFKEAGDKDRAQALEHCQALLSQLVWGLPEGLVYLDGAIAMTKKEEEDRNTLRRNTEAIIAAAKKHSA